MGRFLLAAALVLGAAPPLLADDIEDALKNALQAYKSGNYKDAMDEVAIAQQQLQGKRADGLVGFLPPAPDGWTRTINTDVNQGLAALGGGAGAEAQYEGNGQSFKITVMANNAMVSSMASVLGNASMMATMGKIVRVGKLKFLSQDNQLSGLAGTQVLVQAEGAPVEVMEPILSKMDFDALAKFGS